MTPTCPLCKSERVATLNRARKAAVSIGGVAGAVASASSLWARVRVGAWVGMQVGAGIGIVAGPGGSTIGAVAGAVLAALAGAVAGSSAGAVLGEYLDDKLLDNHQCLACDHRFSLPPTPAHSPDPAAVSASRDDLSED